MREYKTLEQAMLEVKRVVDAELQQFFAGKRKEAQRIHSSVVELVDQVADLTMRGGKRHRPFLCWVGHKAVIGFGLTRNLRCAMLGLELFQTFALIHDDIMDESKERRDGHSVHEHFRVACPPRFAERGWGHLSPVSRASRYGESMGVLAGDLALAWADEEMHNAKCQMIHDIWNAMKEEVIYGQTLDIVGGPKQQADELKTALYSVVRPLQIGSLLAATLSPSTSLGINFVEGSQSQILNTWQRYGLAVGRLFQLRDDVMDGQMTEEAFGRQARGLELQAHSSLETLEASDEVKQLLMDFIQFVQKRKS